MYKPLTDVEEYYKSNTSYVTYNIFLFILVFKTSLQSSKGLKKYKSNIKGNFQNDFTFYTNKRYLDEQNDLSLRQQRPRELRKMSMLYSFPSSNRLQT